MQDYYNSLNYALQSGPLFNLDEDSFYVKAMISKSIFLISYCRYMY